MLTGRCRALRGASGAALRPKTAAQLSCEEVRHLKRCEMAAPLELVPVVEVRVDRRGPAAGRRQIMREHTDADRQLDPPRIVALAKHRTLLEIEARRRRRAVG